jgi:hypothetical protein
MSERQNTLVCIFDMKSPRISAYNIHEWIFETLQLGEEDITMIQIDGPKRNVYIKFKNTDKLQQVLQESKGQRDYKHETGEISKVQIAPAGMGMRTIRIANLPPEVSDRSIINTLARYGEIKEIKEEQWSRSYRYRISNGIRIVTMNLRDHIPSYVNVANNKVLLSYEGQPLTCYGCGNTGHQYQECPTRKNRQQTTGHQFQDCPTRSVRTQQPLNQATTSWAEIVQSRKDPSPTDGDDNNTHQTENGHRNNKAETSYTPIEGKYTETQETERPYKPQQTPMGGEKPALMEIERVTEKPTQMEDNEYQEKENCEDREAMEEDVSETRITQFTTKGEHNTNQETTTTREEEPSQREAQVRDGTSPTTTSDDDIVTPKPLTGNKRMKKQKVTKEIGLVRDNRRSTDRQRKTQRL